MCNIESYREYVGGVGMRRKVRSERGLYKGGGIVTGKGEE